MRQLPCRQHAEVRGGRREGIGRQSIMYLPSHVSLGCKWQNPVRTSFTGSWRWVVQAWLLHPRSSVGFTRNPLLHVLALPPSLSTSCLGRLCSWQLKYRGPLQVANLGGKSLFPSAASKSLRLTPARLGSPVPLLSQESCGELRVVQMRVFSERELSYQTKGYSVVKPHIIQ